MQHGKLCTSLRSCHTSSLALASHASQQSASFPTSTRDQVKSKFAFQNSESTRFANFTLIQPAKSQTPCRPVRSHTYCTAGALVRLLTTHLGVVMLS